MDITIPGVQNPHCEPCDLAMRSCRGGGEEGMRRKVHGEGGGKETSYDKTRR